MMLVHISKANDSFPVFRNSLAAEDRAAGFETTSKRCSDAEEALHFVRGIATPSVGQKPSIDSVGTLQTHICV
jgi:hypothetical protein